MNYRMSGINWVIVGAVAVGPGAAARAGFLDIVAINSGSSKFIGTLDGVAVTGSAVTSLGQYTFSPTGTVFTDATTSTIDGSSPQYSYSNVYDPAVTLTDRVGFAAIQSSTATVTITFATPVTDLRFHVANLNRGSYTFALTGGLNGVSLISGNGSGDDGLRVSGSTVSDANPNTFTYGYGQTTPPTTSGARSAFGTVSLNGTFTVLTMNFSQGANSGGGSFTLSSVPEPTTMAVVSVGGLALLRRRRTAR